MSQCSDVSRQLHLDHRLVLMGQRNRRADIVELYDLASISVVGRYMSDERGESVVDRMIIYMLGTICQLPAQQSTHGTDLR